MAIIKATVSDEVKAAWRNLAAKKGVSESALLAYGVRQILEQLDELDLEPIRRKYREGHGRRLELRLTKKEADSLDKAAIKYGFSSRQEWVIALLRAKLFDLPTPTTEELDALREANGQLRSIGVNLNQIARAANIDINNLEKNNHDALAVLEQAMAAVKQEQNKAQALIRDVMFRWTTRLGEDDGF